jgi:ABC-type multidrug transport system fused ATPase/permease subunit
VEKLYIRYAPDLPDVLHGVSFSVEGGQKIGIVGPTVSPSCCVKSSPRRLTCCEMQGCGKSTLALSFFRFVEAHAGRIVIDGIDIAKVGLSDLRSRISIIPQGLGTKCLSLASDS